MKCPECGEELKNNEVCVFLFDDEGKPIFFHHIDKELHARFLEVCRERGRDPTEETFKFMESYVRYTKNRKYSKEEIPQIINKIVRDLN